MRNGGRNMRNLSANVRDGGENVRNRRARTRNASNYGWKGK